MLGTDAEETSADWGNNEEQALKGFFVSGNGGAKSNDEGRDDSAIENKTRRYRTVKS